MITPQDFMQSAGDGVDYYNNENYYGKGNMSPLGGRLYYDKFEPARGTGISNVIEQSHEDEDFELSRKQSFDMPQSYHNLKNHSRLQVNMSPGHQITPDPNSANLNFKETSTELEFDAMTVITEKKQDPASFGGDQHVPINVNPQSAKKPKIQGAFMEASPKKQQIKAQKQTEQELMNETNISMDKKSELTELTEGHESEENAPSISETTEIVNK